jgi:hypothetical protein
VAWAPPSSRRRGSSRPGGDPRLWPPRAVAGILVQVVEADDPLAAPRGPARCQGTSRRASARRARSVSP